jgi:hypothetical protein
LVGQEFGENKREYRYFVPASYQRLLEASLAIRNQVLLTRRIMRLLVVIAQGVTIPERYSTPSS